MLIRYADAFVVVSTSRPRAIEAQRRVRASLARLGLQLNPDKTKIVHLGGGAAGFDFLGFHMHKVESWRWPGRWYLQRWPSQRAMSSIRDKVRAATDRRLVGYSLEMAVQRLNPVLRGWSAYFRNGNSSRKFTTIDSYVHQRLARLASMKHGRSHINWASHFDSEWLQALGVYRLTGTIRWGSAHATR